MRNQEMIRDTQFGFKRTQAATCRHADCPRGEAKSELVSAREVVLNLFCLVLVIAIHIPYIRMLESWADVRVSNSFISWFGENR